MLKIGHIIVHVWEVKYRKKSDRLEPTPTEELIIMIKLASNKDYTIDTSTY